jgi:hypothetical protein
LKPVLTLIVAVLVAANNPVLAKEHRSREVAREFEWQHPCPSTGRANGACPGYVRDHVVPLSCGGPDAVENMQCQTVAGAADGPVLLLHGFPTSSPTAWVGGSTPSLMGTTTPHPVNQHAHTARPSFWHFLQITPLFMAYIV